MKSLALILALALPAIAHAQPPMLPPGPAAPLATIDQLYARILDLRAKQAELQKQKDDLAKQEEAAKAELKARLKELLDLGLIDPPKPPAPPKPPEPADPLKQKLADAYKAAAGTEEQKREWVLDLAALYRQAKKAASDPSLATAAALRKKLGEVSASLIGPDSLVEVRKAIAGELAAILPASDAELTAEQRAAAVALFAKLAVILDGLGQ